MSEDRARQSPAWAVLGVALLIPPVCFMIRWIVLLSNVAKTQAELVAEFLSIFPTALQDATMLTWVAIVFSVAAVVVAWKPMTGGGGIARVVGMTTILLGSLMTLWFLFSLM